MAARKKASRARTARTTTKTQSDLRSDHVAKDKKDRKRKDKSTWLKSPRKVTDEDVRHVVEAGVGKADELLDSAFEWVTQLARQAKALYDMLVAWWRGKYEFPKATIGAITLALLYFVSPFDILPDVLPVLGLVDDAAVIAFVTRMLQGDIRRYAKKFGVPLKDLGLSKP